MKKLYILMLLTAVFAMLSGFLFIELQQERNSRTTTENYPLLSKRLDAPITNDIIINFEPLRAQIKDYLAQINLRHSFYFEYLPSGVNVRAGEDNELAAASLMKTPLIIDLYHAAELGKIDINKERAISSSALSNDNEFGNTTNLQVGQKISLRMAAKLTLSSSDNTAARFINENLAPVIKASDKALNFLDLPVTRQETDQGEYVTVSAKSYSSILKCLYVSCLLRPDHSQEILTYLSQSENRSRLPAGIPNGIPVANKLGTFSDQSQSDCGIVYEPGRPFLICMMLFAPYSENVDAHFKTIAKLCYDYVHNAKQPSIEKK